MGKRSNMTAAAVILVITVAADILAGAAASGEVLFLLRIPRAVTAMVSGAALALAGLQLQAIFRNPLADPHIMGVSSGAGLGAAIAVLAGTGASAGFTGGISVAAAASAGALLSSLLIILISKKAKRDYTLLIFGVLTGFAFNALTSILQSWADPESLRIYYSWSAGSFINSGYDGIAIIASGCIIGTAIACGNAKGLDSLLFGDDFSSLSGARPERIRWISLAGCCLMTGAVTAFCGPVGFVGITAPHIARKLMGTTSHLSVIPATLLTGGIMGAVADLLSRCGPYPLPAGSTMALIGIPIILYIMLRPEKSACISRVCTSEEFRMKKHTSRETIHMDGIDIGYSSRTLCSDISFRLHPGDCILLCGANGSGKTTLLRTLASLWPDRVTMIPADIPKVKGFTLEEFIRTGCYTMSDWKGLLSPESERKASEVMDRLRIGQFRNKDISTLSDGEFRKGCIASALCRDSETIILDEPEAFLDTESRIEVLSLLRQIAAEGSRSVIFSSHDIATALKFCNRVAAIGHDHKFRISSELNGNGSNGAASEDSRNAEKIRTARSIFRNKSITFDV